MHIPGPTFRISDSVGPSGRGGKNLHFKEAPPGDLMVFSPPSEEYHLVFFEFPDDMNLAGAIVKPIVF